MKYRREIDGLRAVAVMPVILFHAGFSVFSGGYVGVDVFFVISGYLITSILIAELEQGRFSIIRFYERRVRRILPALFFVLLACLPFAYMWLLPPQLKDFAQSLVSVVFFGSNVLFWIESGYFESAAELKPLLHTWSLAVEEQYYLIFPMFLLIAWRYGRNRVFWSVVVISAMSLLLAEWGWRNDPDANFYLAPTRAWELLAGSICAFLTVGRAVKSNGILSVIGLAAIVFSVFSFDENTPFPSIYALFPVVGTALIILFATQGTWVARLLSMRVLVGIGLISYSAYLWHQPVFAFARLRSSSEPDHYLMGALAIAALVLAWGTWRWVEQPFRRPTSPMLATRRAVFVASGAFGAFIVAIGIVGHTSQGNFFRYDPRIVSSLRDAESGSPVVDLENRVDDGQCVFSAPHLSEEIANRIGECATMHGPGILVIGDSHATNLFHSIVRSERNVSTSFLIGITTNGCHLPEIRKGCPYNEIYHFVENNQFTFARILYEKAGYLMFIPPENRDVRAYIRNGGSAIVDEERISGVVTWLNGLAEFSPIIWYGPRLSPLISHNEFYERGCDGDFSIKDSHVETYAKLDSAIEGLVKQGGNLRYVSQINAMNFSYPEDFGGCDDLLWFDESHFSRSGETNFGNRFDLLSGSNDGP